MVKAKLFFLALLIIAGIFVSSFAQQPQAIKKTVKAQPVASLQVPTMQSLTRALTFSAFQKKASDIVKNILGETTEGLEKSADNVEKKATTMIYETALKPILQQVNNLPEAQRVKLLETVCRDTILDKPE